MKLVVAFVAVGWLVGCQESERAPRKNPTAARDLLSETMTNFHARSAEVTGPERARLLNEAALRYDDLIKRFPTDSNVCAQATRALGSIHANQGRTNEAVKLYAAVGEKYPGQDWEVLQAWKAAGDLCWEGNRHDEARNFYARIVERFGNKDAPQIIQTVVRGSKARLAEP